MDLCSRRSLSPPHRSILSHLQATGIFADHLLENWNAGAEHEGEQLSDIITVRMLVGHTLMGSVIGGFLKGESAKRGFFR